MGKIGEMPIWFTELEASKILQMPFLELHNHPQKMRLIEIAEIYTSAKNEGEFNLQCNPEFVVLAKKRADEIQVAQK